MGNIKYSPQNKMQWGILQRCRRAWGKDGSGLRRGAAVCFGCVYPGAGALFPGVDECMLGCRVTFLPLPAILPFPAAPRCLPCLQSSSLCYTRGVTHPQQRPESGGAGLLKLKLSFPCPDAADEPGSVAQAVDKTVLVHCFSCLSCQKSCAGRFLRVILAQI